MNAIVDSKVVLNNVEEINFQNGMLYLKFASEADRIFAKSELLDSNVPFTEDGRFLTGFFTSFITK